MTATATTVPRHVMWRRQYDQRRYARHLSQVELNKRIRDILLNMLILTPEAKIGLLPITPESAIWMEKWTHVLEEMQLRFGPYPAGFTRGILHSEPFPNFVCDLADRAASTMREYRLQSANVLVKFGRRCFMERLYREGSLRVQAASFFSGTDLTGAIRDDELTIPMSFALSREDVIDLVINPQDVPSDLGDQRFDVRLQHPSDYWLYCLSSSVEPRLFVDFKADACVIIDQPATFSRRLEAACCQSLANCRMHEGHAQYVDPLFPTTMKLFVPFCKYFGYSYQREYRYSWLPQEPAAKLSHVDLTVGSLEDIAHLITL